MSTQHQSDLNKQTDIPSLDIEVHEMTFEHIEIKGIHAYRHPSKSVTDQHPTARH